jgi:nicotinamide-nucleotide amidase
MLLEQDTLAASIGELLQARQAKIAVAETTAGGLISARLLSVPGASAWFDRGHVAYSGPAKLDGLRMDRDLLRENGSVSKVAVTAQAEAVRDVAGVEFGLAESGIAGPQGSRRSPKPVGSVVIAVAAPWGAVAEEHVFSGTRVQVMEQIAQRSLELLLESLEGGEQ